MLTATFLVTLLLFCQGFQDVLLRSLCVSHAGQDVFSCGNQTSPCRSVRFAVTISKSNDEILIDATQAKPYQECIKYSNSFGCSIMLNKSLSFIGTNGTAVIQCRPNCNLFNVEESVNKTVLVFSHLVMSRSDTVVQCSNTEVELVFKKCILKTYNTGVRIKNSMQCSIQTFNSSFEVSRDGAIFARCINLTANFTDSFFYASPVFLQGKPANQNDYARETNQVFISNCVFDGQRKQLSREMLAILPHTPVVNITVHASTFRNHITLSKKVKGLPAFVIYDNNYPIKSKQTFISLNKLLVENNWNPFSAIHFSSVFTQSQKKFFKVEILNSIFRNNSGAFKVSLRGRLHQRIRITGPAVNLTNNTFEKNINGYAGKYSVTFNGGISHLTSCRFLDNTAGDYPYAAVITIINRGGIIFENCYYENTRTDTNSISVFGDVNSRVWFKGKNSFNITAWKTGQTIFLHMPSKIKPGVLLEGSFRILCPQGNVLKAESTIFDEDHKHKIDCSYLHVACHQCPPRTYSIERGALYTNMSLRNVHCRNCPRGGLCEEGQVTAKPNFWGYRNKGSISFLSCPQNYCCDEENCQSFDSCDGNRSGTLCGQCPDGMSEPLFNTKCTANDKCTSTVFWPGVLCYLILYLVFFLYHEEITSFVRKGLSLKLPLISKIQQRKDHNSNNDMISDNNHHHHSKDGGFLKILFYYYQIINLFRSSVVSRRNKQILVKLEKLFSRAFNFLVINIPSFGCPFQNLRPVEKTFILHSVGYCLLALIGFFYIFTKLFKIARRAVLKTNDSSQTTSLELFEINNQTQHQKSRITVRIASTFTYISLLMYSSSAKLCFSLLHCVPVRNKLVLFLDGTTNCHQTFQYFLIAYAIFSILPFCLVPVLGSYLLQLDRISVWQFCIACIFPLPFCCFWIYLLLKNCSLRRNSVYNTIKEENDLTAEHKSSTATSSRTAILRVLLGPFRAHEPVLCFPASFLPWEGFLIFRRLVLIVVLTLIYDNRLKLVVALLICIAILISHMYVKPFISSWENIVESLSLGTLIFLCGLTLVKALYQGEDFSSSSNSSTLLDSFDMVEGFIIVTPLAIVIFIATLSLLIRLIFGFQLCIRVCLRFLGRLCGGR